MWNYRVATKDVNGQEVVGIVQCTYDRDDATKIDAHSDFIELGGFASAQLLEKELGYVMAALQKPVVHGLDFSQAIHPDELIDDLSDAEMAAMRAAAALETGSDMVITRSLF